MAESESGLTDAVDDLDLEDLNTGDERHFDIEVIENNVEPMYDKVHLLFDFWKEMYVNFHAS